MLFDSNRIDLCSFWFVFSSLTAKSSHTGFSFERSLSDSLKMPAELKEIIPREYYFKMSIDSCLQKWSIMWVLSGAGRYSGEKWHCVMSYQFQWLKEKHLVGLGSKEHKPWLRRLHKLGADSLQNKRHQLCWLLTQFARGLTQFHSQEVLPWSPETLLAMHLAKKQKKSAVSGHNNIPTLRIWYIVTSLGTVHSWALE